MSIISPNPGKLSPDINLIVVENRQDNPLGFQLVYTPNPPHFRSVGRINTIYDMHDLMSESFQIIAPLKEDCQPFVATDDLFAASGFSIDRSLHDHGLYIAPDFPEFLIPRATPQDYKSSPQVVRNAITWGVVRSEPGTVSQDRPFMGTQEVKARTREFIAYYADIGKNKIIGTDTTILKGITENFSYVKMKGQYFDNLIQYNIWSKTNYEAERLTEWFLDEYMDNYIGMFREAGIVQMHFDRRVRDDTIIQMKSSYHVRSVLYYIRTERIKPELIGPIKQVTLNISIENLQSYINDLGDSNLESQHDKLLSKWIHRNQLGG